MDEKKRAASRRTRIEPPEYDEAEAHREHDATDVWEPR